MMVEHQYLLYTYVYKNSLTCLSSIFSKNRDETIFVMIVIFLLHNNCYKNLNIAHPYYACHKISQFNTCFIKMLLLDFTTLFIIILAGKFFVTLKLHSSHKTLTMKLLLLVVDIVETDQLCAFPLVGKLRYH